MEDAFSRFGPLKRAGAGAGVHLKDVKGRPSYAFVDYESPDSAQAALAAAAQAPVMVAGHAVSLGCTWKVGSGCTESLFG